MPTLVGGSQHIAEWQANTPGNAATIFQMMVDLSLPGLPNCRGFESRLTPAALAHLKINGCPYPLTRS